MEKKDQIHVIHKLLDEELKKNQNTLKYGGTLKSITLNEVQITDELIKQGKAISWDFILGEYA